MKNLEVARLFDLMADILEIEGENPFRIRAYPRAAQNLESLTEDLEALARANRLDEIPGVGEDLAAKIGEYLATGRIGDIEAVAAAMAAQRQGVARLEMSREQVHASAVRVMREARDTLRVLMREGLIPAPPAP